MRAIEVNSQAELDAIKWDGRTIAVVRKGFYVALDSATVRAGGSATVRAWGSATVLAWDSATVLAWDSATVRAGDSATVRAGGSATVHATSPVVPIQTLGKGVTVTGKGIVIPIDPPRTAEGWCERNGLEPDRDGIVTPYKVVGPDYLSGWKMDYTPGTTPEAPDWNPEPECGGGLHFVADPWLARRSWNQWGDDHHLIACPVRLDEIVVHPDGNYPEKVKAPRVVAPVYEVDVDGNRIESEVAA